MNARPSQLPYVTRAEGLASQLNGVERNVFLSVVADFLTDARSTPASLGRLIDLLKKGSGGHLNRSGAFGEQARIVIQELPSILRDPDLSPAELRAVLGWTARLLQARSAKRVGGGGGGSKPVREKVPFRQQQPANQIRPTKPSRRPASTAPPPRPAPGPAAPEPPKWRERIRGLGWGNAGSIVSTLLAELAEDQRREAARAVIETLGGRRALRPKLDKAWVQDLLAAAGDSP